MKAKSRPTPQIAFVLTNRAASPNRGERLTPHRTRSGFSPCLHWGEHRRGHYLSRDRRRLFAPVQRQDKGAPPRRPDARSWQPVQE